MLRLSPGLVPGKSGASTGTLKIKKKMNNNINEVRILNMEEKRKIEKMMFIDIDVAIANVESKKDAEIEIEENRLKKNPPAAVKKLAAEHKALKTRDEKIDEELTKLGFNVDYDGEISINSNNAVPSIKSVADKAESQKSQLEALRRKTTLSLYANGETTAKLFISLAAEIKKILNS